MFFYNKNGNNWNKYKKNKDNIGQIYTSVKDLRHKPSLIVEGLTEASNPEEEIKLYKY